MGSEGLSEVGTADASEGRPDLVARFLDDPSHARALDFAAQYLNAAFDSPASLLGSSVGVTVFPGGDGRVLIRVNTGRWLAADECREGSDLRARVFLATRDGDTELERLAIAVNGSLREGFPRVALDNRALEFTGPDRATQLFADPVAVARIREFVDETTRFHLKSDWHNPAINDLLRPLLSG